MPQGWIPWAISLVVLVTVYWAAVWYWLPALVRKREQQRSKEPPPPDSQA